MGFERLLCGALERYSGRFRLGNIQQEVRLFASRRSSCSVSTRLIGGSGLFSWVFVNPGRQALALRRSFSTQPSKDVTLFVHDNTIFSRVVSAFCGGQLVFWTYMAHFAFTELKDTGGAEGKSEALTTTALAGIWRFEMNLGSSAWRYGFTLGCLVIGVGMTGLGALFCLRSVSKVVLHKGGSMVTICTQSPLGLGRGKTTTVPLSQVACYTHRQQCSSFIPLRIKGHKLYFLLDKDGTMNNTRLFDVTVGAYRKL